MAAGGSCRRRGRRTFRWSSPTRRSVTAHGQIRHTYRLVDGGPAVPLFPDLIGFGPLPADRRLDLAQVFDVPGRPPAQRAKRLDGRLAASLIGLPGQITGAVDTAAYRSVAVRDLLRGGTAGLPSGEAVAPAGRRGAAERR
jgi:hypothetical protein